MNVYNIAGMNIGIDAKCEFTYEKCISYRPNRAIPEFVVSATDEQIKKEQSLGNFSYDYCEFICLYREICSKLPLYNRLLMHAAVIEKDRRAYAFAAKSGTGKTTHILKWKELFGDSVSIINGDKPILRFEENEIIACGTPWCGKEGLNLNTEAPLKAICFINRSDTNRIEEMNKTESLDKIFGQLFIPQDKEAAAKTLELCSVLLNKIKLYNLYCNMETEAAQVAYDTLSKA